SVVGDTGNKLIEQQFLLPNVMALRPNGAVTFPVLGARSIGIRRCHRAFLGEAFNRRHRCHNDAHGPPREFRQPSWKSNAYVSMNGRASLNSSADHRLATRQGADI